MKIQMSTCRAIHRTSSTIAGREQDADHAEHRPRKNSTTRTGPSGTTAASRDGRTVHSSPMQRDHPDEPRARSTVELFPDDAPKTVENFVKLANDGFYDRVIFHRVIPDFMIQGGDPTGTGCGGPGYSFEDEFNDHKVERGALAMANAGPNTNGSQFFIVTDRRCPVARRQTHRLRPRHRRHGRRRHDLRASPRRARQAERRRRHRERLGHKRLRVTPPPARPVPASSPRRSGVLLARTRERVIWMTRSPTRS